MVRDIDYPAFWAFQGEEINDAEQAAAFGAAFFSQLISDVQTSRAKLLELFHLRIPPRHESLLFSSRI